MTIKQAQTLADYLEQIETEEKRALAQYFLALYRETVNNNAIKNSTKESLINHNAPTQNISEAATLAAHALMSKPDPLTAACAVIKDFHSVFPIKEVECVLIFPLIAIRLLIAAAFSSIKVDNNYLQISAKSAWNALKKLSAIPPALAHFSFREVCGFEPCPKNLAVRHFIKKEQGNFAPIIPIDFKKEKKIVLDLSVGSSLFGNNLNFEDSARFDALANQAMKDAGVKMSIGKYDEVRPLYITESYKVKGNEGPMWRTVHVGLDIFMQAGTPVFAPLEGRVHSFQNNVGERDYGPTIILEHTVENDLVFYTLYGHLGLESLNGLKAGMLIKKGQQIATIGSISVNGNWPPHLHFQVILDLLGFSGDFPGVAFPHQRAIWTSLCPDPSEMVF